jgi:hypothetical protein
VLPDLLSEIDSLPPRARLLSLVQGILAGNIFDWGARACVELYTNGTILDIYRSAAGQGRAEGRAGRGGGLRLGERGPWPGSSQRPPPQSA